MDGGENREGIRRHNICAQPVIINSGLGSTAEEKNPHLHPSTEGTHFTERFVFIS